MSWFGWLTKGKCEVSALDVFTASGEVLALLFAVAVVDVYIYRPWKRRRKSI